MRTKNNFVFPSIFLRVAIAIPYLWFVADRLGLLGVNDQPHVGWGDWQHFLQYAREVMSFLPAAVIPFFAITATACELIFGLLLLFGRFTKIAAAGSGILSFLFAVSMAISFGIESSLGYSVFTVSAASFSLAAMPVYSWSFDQYFQSKK